MSNLMLAAALDVAGHGWPVFPLVIGGKAPAVKNWEQRATTDPERIRRGWTAGPYNIGLATGPAGLVVIDLDVVKPGEQAPDGQDLAGIRHGLEVLALLAEDAGQPLPTETFTVATPSGGLHLYFTAPADVEYRNTAGRLGWHIDTRAHGGYVVAPGSIVNGKPYEVTEAAPVVELFAWIADRLRPAPPPAPAAPIRLPSGDRRSKYLDAAIAAEVARVEGATAGARNEALYLAAVALGQLAAGGCLTEDEVRGTLTRAAAGYIAVDPGRRQYKVDATITSGLKAGAKRPRQVAA
ncbi:bifunctional DNA primase/polymerase [Lentzea roselyniae]|uniref:Bifunctional DNA primase/polymerase n=1 Tax=Lentzea roselyniae TaxID=531940 RepID=A0ABP7ARN6_9PSEU